MTIRNLGRACVLLAVVCHAPSAAAQAPDGPGLFRAYCAPCHGAEARGNGPVASAMRKAPPDLTQLSRQNNGVFPAARIRRIVEGREVPSHGTREMPVWGDIFMVAKEGGAATVGARVDAIIRHLESLQMKQAQ
jgi:hypothetical protein